MGRIEIRDRRAGEERDGIVDEAVDLGDGGSLELKRGAELEGGTVRSGV